MYGDEFRCPRSKDEWNEMKKKKVVHPFFKPPEGEDIPTDLLDDYDRVNDGLQHYQMQWRRGKRRRDCFMHAGLVAGAGAAALGALGVYDYWQWRRRHPYGAGIDHMDFDQLYD